MTPRIKSPPIASPIMDSRLSLFDEDVVAALDGVLWLPELPSESEQTYFLLGFALGLLIPVGSVRVTKVVEYWPFAAVTVLNTTDTEVLVANTLEPAPPLVVAVCVVEANTNVEVWSAVAQYCV
jgi:L-lactate permease